MERISEGPNVTESLQGRVKTKLGRIAARTAMITAATATIFAGVTAGEAITDTDQQAHAESPLGSMNGAEKAWCSWPSRWNLCFRTQQLSQDAGEAASLVAVEYNRQPHNGDADAFRHCYWSGLMAKEFGWETAKDFGDRHEYNDDQHPFEAEADLYNNRQGRIWAQEVDDIGKRCLDGMLNNELQIVIPAIR